MNEREFKITTNPHIYRGINDGKFYWADETGDFYDAYDTYEEAKEDLDGYLESK